MFCTSRSDISVWYVQWATANDVSPQMAGLPMYSSAASSEAKLPSSRTSFCCVARLVRSEVTSAVVVRPGTDEVASGNVSEKSTVPSWLTSMRRSAAV